MGAGSRSGKGGAGGVNPILPNRATSGKGGSNAIPPAQPNQPTLGNQLNPQQPTMGKGGAMPQQPTMGKGGAMPQQPMQQPMQQPRYGTSQEDYNRFMATAKFAPGAEIPTYEQWNASRMGKGGAQPIQPEQPVMGKGGAQPQQPMMPVPTETTPGKGGGIATLPRVNPGRPAPRPAPITVPRSAPLPRRRRR